MKTTACHLSLVLGLVVGVSTLQGQTYEYDAAGRLTRVAYADGAGVRYQYDEADNLLSVLPLSIPPAPDGVSVTRDSASQATVTWTDRSSNETGFIVQRRTSGDYAWVTLATLPANVFSHTDTSLDSHTAYAYRIQALGATGASAYSATESAVLVGGQLANISNRAQVGTGADVLIPGFVIEGGAAKPMLIRAVGPTLAAFGVTGELEDPVLQVFHDGAEVASNDDWGQAPDPDALTSAFAETGAFELPLGSKDAALLVTLQPGAYTARVSGAGNTPGVSLVEVYDVDADNPSSRLVNISGRAQVGSGSDILIPGFVVGGSGTSRFLIRAIGPTLGEYGVTGVLADPTLTVLSGNSTVAQNDNWSDAANTADIVSTSATIGAFALPEDSADAVVLVSLPTGAYTIQVSGVGGTTGVALVEVYEVP